MQGLSRFETERLDRIRRNNEYLKELGLDNENSVVKRKRRTRRTKTSEESVIRRRSPRLAKLAPSGGLEKKMTRSKKIRRVNKIRDTLEHANEMQKLAFDLAENLDKNLNNSIVSRRLLTDKTWDEQMIEDAQDLRPRFRIRDRVAVRYKGGPDWFECTVIGTNTNGSYHVRYPDGEEETQVRWIRSLPSLKRKKKKRGRKMKLDRLIIVVMSAFLVLYLIVRFFFSLLSIFVGDDARCVVPPISRFEGVHTLGASCIPGNIVRAGTVCAVEPTNGFKCIGECEISCLENGMFDVNFDMVKIDNIDKSIVEVEMERENEAVEMERENEAVEVEVNSHNEVVDVGHLSHHLVDTVSIPNETSSLSTFDDDLDAVVDRILEDVRRESTRRMEEERLLLEKQRSEDVKRRQEEEERLLLEQQRREDVKRRQEEEERLLLEKQRSEDAKRRQEEEERLLLEKQRSEDAKRRQEEEERLLLEKQRSEDVKRRQEEMEDAKSREEEKEEEDKGANLPAEVDMAQEQSIWLSEKWNERASFARASVSKLDQNCKYLRHFLGKTSPESCAALSLGHEACGLTPPISRNDERPSAADVVRFIWTGGKGCFCCSKTKNDSIDKSWFVSKLQNARISLEMYETCVVCSYSADSQFFL